MKNILLILLFISSPLFGQMTLDQAKEKASAHNFTTYRYHQKFEGNIEYAAPIVVQDESIIFFSKDKESREYSISKIDMDGELIWQKTIQPEYDELESQSILINQDGLIFAFLLAYNYDIYRGGTEQVICLDYEGNIIWDKLIGNYGLVNSPTFSWIRLNADGEIELRGHIVTDLVEEDERPEYKYWRAWLSSDGKLREEIGEVLDWSDPKTKALFEIEE